MGPLVPNFLRTSNKYSHSVMTKAFSDYKNMSMACMLLFGLNNKEPLLIKGSFKKLLVNQSLTTVQSVFLVLSVFN